MLWYFRKLTQNVIETLFLNYGESGLKLNKSLNGIVNTDYPLKTGFFFIQKNWNATIV